jgi:uncharacterized cupin superfamily protein
METRAAIEATSVVPVAKQTTYPEPFASRMGGRVKRRLGDTFGLTNFGVNLTVMAPRGSSALRHCHLRQDEFIYIVSGHPTLHTDQGYQKLSPGMCVGFKAGTGDGHRLLNETDAEVTYLEIGDRMPDDEVTYPDDDLKAVEQNGVWKYLHADGTPY